MPPREPASTYARDKIKRQPNTIDSHRLILWAGDDGARMKQRLMTLYFAEGGDLSDREVLGQSGSRLRHGRRRRCVPVWPAMRTWHQIEAEANSAKEGGIDGVPFFIFGGLIAVSGAQPPEYLAQAMERAAAEMAKRVAAE